MSLLKRLRVIFFLTLLLSGCGSLPVAEDLTQRDANEIVALLNTYGITASVEHETGGRGRYSVSVDKSLASQSRVLMQLNDLPRATEMPFNDLIAQQGLIPNSREIEAARIDRARALELEILLQSHPMVALAKVVLRSNLLKSGSESSVSVVVQTKKSATENSAAIATPTPESANAASQETNRDPLVAVSSISAPNGLVAELFSIVSNSLPDVKHENIRISITPELGRKVADDVVPLGSGQRRVQVPLVPFMIFWHVPPDEVQWLYLAVLGLCAVVLAAGGFVGYWYGFFRQSRQFFENELAEIGQTPSSSALRIDRGGGRGKEVANK